MSITERLQVGLAYAMSLALVVSIGFSLWNGFWFNAFLGIVAFVMTYIPSILRRNYRIHVPTEFELFFIFFIFASIYLGEVRSYYTHYWWWDIFLHTFSGLLLGLVGFLMVFILNTEKDIPLKMSPFFVGLFSCSFAMSLGVLWELFEFFMDVGFGFNMQKSGIVDTMTDLLVNMLGAFVMALSGFYYTKKVRFALFDRMIQQFVQKNPKLFRLLRKR